MINQMYQNIISEMELFVSNSRIDQLYQIVRAEMDLLITDDVITKRWYQILRSDSELSVLNNLISNKTIHHKLFNYRERLNSNVILFTISLLHQSAVRYYTSKTKIQ